MRKKTPESINPHLEEQLTALYQSRSPHPVFADRLERKLIARAAGLPRTVRPGTPVSSLFAALQRPAWAVTLMGVLILALTVGLIGPQRVLAAVQEFLGYVPGIGFVDLDQARVLAAPVAVTRDGVTLQVDSVFAHPKGTVLLISTQGLPPEGIFNPGFNMNSEFLPTLRLSDGQRLQQRASEYSYGWGKLEFGPIPAEVNHITLELNRLPLVPPGAAPENWLVPLTLIPLQGKLSTDRYPQPYSPSGASETVNGVTLSVIGVAQSARETGVQVQVTWEDPAWRWSSSMDLVLQDDIGHRYQEVSSSLGSVASVVVEPLEEGVEPAPGLPTATETHIFAPLSLAAQRVTLRIDQVYFDMPAQATFTIDLGANPQVGQTWALDEHLQVAGFPVHVVGAQLTDDTRDWQDETGPFYTLEFILEVTPQADRSLYTLLLDSPGARSAGFSGGSGSRNVASLIFQRSLPATVEISFQEAGIALHGPWNITWDVSAREGARYSVRELHPTQAEEDRDGLTLGVKEVLITDEVTLVRIGASGLPAGAAVVDLAGPGQPGQRAWPSLEDQRGVRLEGLPEASWANPQESDTDQRLTFASPSPLARSLTLNIPGVELFLPGAASITVEVPEALTFHEEVYETVVIGADRSDYRETGTRWVSDWGVDLPVEIAGYGLHFTRAQIEGDENLSAAGRYWLTLSGEVLPGEHGNRQLIELRFAQITRPDGETQRADSTDQPWEALGMPSGGIGWADLRQASLRMNVSDKTGLDLLPGQYTIDLNGVVVSVSGPWRLRWNLAGP